MIFAEQMTFFPKHLMVSAGLTSRSLTLQARRESD
jgi:hypothetical protein